jgi:hypothetical protein
MLKYNGKDSKALTVLVGIATLAKDLGEPLGWDGEDDPALDERAHPSDQVLAILEAFGCFEYTSPDADDPMEAEFYEGGGVADIVGILCAVRDMPEYTEIMTAGIRPDCFN